MRQAAVQSRNIESKINWLKTIGKIKNSADYENRCKKKKEISEPVELDFLDIGKIVVEPEAVVPVTLHGEQEKNQIPHKFRDKRDRIDYRKVVVFVKPNFKFIVLSE